MISLVMFRRIMDPTNVPRVLSLLFLSTSKWRTTIRSPTPIAVCVWILVGLVLQFSYLL
ncbi:hypothetical protein BDZ91DRAFT_737644 [Kalaharituber pfeilii]|nr:hypothetical protein BDZ91DRAFT_737644 [Kalaharituber pfeilii]